MSAFDDIVASPESKTFERKRDLSSMPSILRSVVAFANGAGGRIVVGIDDAGNILGVDDPIDAEEKLANAIAHGVTPMVVPEIALIEEGQRALLVVEVHPSGRRPHFVAADGAAAGTYVRIGASNRRADQELRAELARAGRQVGYDEEPVLAVSIDELDIDTLRTRMEGVRGMEALRTLDIATEVDAALVPTNAGVLSAAFPATIVERFPEAIVHAVRFDNADVAVVRRTIAGTIFDMIDRSIGFVHEMMGDRVVVQDVGVASMRTTVAPQLAVRELVVNAFAHADYALRGGPFRLAIHPDRVVIENPGLLVPGMTVDDLGNGVSRVRNRAIARILREAGYIEQWGSGVQRARRSVDDAGLPPPRFEELAPHRFRATIFTAQVRSARLSESETDLLNALRAVAAASTSDLVKMTSRSERWVRQHASRLVELGFVEVEGRGPRRRYRVLRP